MKYWLVCCNSGHVGRKKSGELALAIEAPDGVTAMLIAKRFPAVKRKRSAYLCTVREIDREEYISEDGKYCKQIWDDGYIEIFKCG